MRTFSPLEKRALWEGWKSGLSLVEIAHGLDRQPTTVLRIIRDEGGIAPRPHQRSGRALRAVEREEISRGIAAGLTIRQIASRLGRAASTVSREVNRNGGLGRYRAAQAEAAAWSRARRPQQPLLCRRPQLCSWVALKLERNWSPRQISVGLEREFPDDARMRVSHETIYRSLFVQARGVFKAELVKHLRRAGYLRHSRLYQRPAEPAIVDGLSIRERPAEVEDRAVPGHWEGDLLMGGNSSQIATLVERHSRFVMLVKIDKKDTRTVTRALAHKIRELPRKLRRTLTWDRGSELRAHRDFTLATDVQVYFCDPRSPWQRGSNENTNGLLRQYFPKGEDVSRYTQAQLDHVATELNERPRETLKWLTPLEALRASVASTT